MATVLERPNVRERADALDQTMTPEEYLAWERAPERANERRSEYFWGEVIEVSGASFYHNVIVSAIITLLSSRLSDEYYVIPSDLRVRVGRSNAYVYPDIVVFNEPQFLDDRFDTLLNPTLLVEILSPSTSQQDRVTKLDLYRDIESLTDYLIVSQDEARIEHYARVDDDEWLLKSYRGLDATAHIDSLNCDLPLAEIYARIKFDR